MNDANLKKEADEMGKMSRSLRIELNIEWLSLPINFTLQTPPFLNLKGAEILFVGIYNKRLLRRSSSAMTI